MSALTPIQWTDRSWNPIRGCTVVSEGCRNCYAMKTAARFIKPGQAYEGLARRRTNGVAQWTGEVRFIEKDLTLPLKWRKPQRIFVNSMSDLFHEKVTDDQLDKIFAVMALAQRHQFQVLTKRPERMREYVQSKLRDRRDRHTAALSKALSDIACSRRMAWRLSLNWPLPNVWLGVSTEDQATADKRIPLLLHTPAAVRFLSMEPLLGPIDLVGWIDGSWCSEGGDETDLKPNWVIVGGESGPDARSCNQQWIREVVADCKDASVPVFVKQLGGFSELTVPIAGSRVHTAPVNFKDKIGGNITEWPEDLRVREFPEVRSCA